MELFRSSGIQPRAHHETLKKLLQTKVGEVLTHTSEDTKTKLDDVPAKTSDNTKMMTSTPSHFC